MKQLEQEKLATVSRHPIVVILGHIDHGKTTLLDTIRNTNVVAREAGGITQHLSAYEIEHNGTRITFLDTPGHETFSKMRERGARVADIAILVVAADDGVKPQTKEAFEAIKKADIPYVVALNKIDKPSADPNRARAELAEMGVLVEGWGGQVPCVEISAKKGEHINDLLDTVVLVSELEELSGDSLLPGTGVVIEAHLDPRRGPSATLLITNGSVKRGEFVRAGDASAPVRILENWSGKNIDEAGPSSAILIAGFNKVPDVGAPFASYASRVQMEADMKMSEGKSSIDFDAGSGDATIGILLKADVGGSLEAITDEVRRTVPKELPVKFFDGGVGDITENDIKAVSSAHSVYVLGFHVKAKKQAEELAARFHITIKTFSIIYEAIEWIEGELKKHVPKKIIREEQGKLLVLKTFQSPGKGKVIGGRVREGKIPSDAVFDVLRQGERVGTGTVLSLQRNKIAVEALREGEEGGLLVQSAKAIEERDVLVFYHEREA